MQYVYKVRNLDGSIQEASARADSPADLRARLRARGLDIVDIREDKGSSITSKLTSIKLEEVANISFFDHISLKDMVVFSRQFSAMISSGVAMLRTLTIIVEQCNNRKLKKVLDEVRVAIESGLSLSDAMGRHPQVFDKLYVSMVKAGETGGILSDVLKRLADFLEYKSKLNQKVTAAMVYPTVVLFIAVAVFWGMLTFILPIFEGLFHNIGGELPAYTQMLIALSQAMRSIWMLLFLIAVAVGIYYFKRYYATGPGRYQVDFFLLSLPFIGDLIAKVSVARFARTFGTLLQAGVPMLTALEVVKDTAGNAVVADSVQKVYNDVRQGGTLSKPMTRAKVFPPMVTQMVAVGEETGRLDDMLSKVADFYDMEVENAVEALTALLEPIMVVGIGGIVGSVVVGMYLPIFTVINQLR